MSDFSDPNDHASLEEDRHLERSLANYRIKRERERLPLVGLCHNCDERIHERLFCDEDCSTDYMKRTRRGV